MAGYSPDIDDLGVDGLKELVLRVVEENAALKAEVTALREEIARLKGLKGRPAIKPSGMDKAVERKGKTADGRFRPRGSKNARLSIDEERVIKADVAVGWRFKGYEDFIVQDLMIEARVIRLRRERWVTPTGGTVTAPLPEGIVGHFGPGLRRFVLALYHQGQSTVERVFTLLRDLGVDISRRQLMRLLIARQERFLDEDAGVLRAGLETASWITVDDTGARHKGRNGTCTRIGNDDFAWFATTGSKSRLNFLELLRAGHEDYVINGAALEYMRTRQLADPLIARLAAQQHRRLADREGWMAHLDRLGIAARPVHPDPRRIATEGALWGSIVEHGLVRDAVIVSDDAGQFNVGHHALCWVHAERLVHKLDVFCDRQRHAKERIQIRIWWLYADIKAYCRDPTPQRKAALERRFERLFTTRTGFATLDRLLSRLHANRDELLVALERPEVPLHTNDAERDIRCQVTRRKVSGGTRSDAGRDCRDAFAGLIKTCAKLGIRFWDYLGNRLHIPDAASVIALPELIRQRALV